MYIGKKSSFEWESNGRELCCLLQLSNSLSIGKGNIEWERTVLLVTAK